VTGGVARRDSERFCRFAHSKMFRAKGSEQYGSVDESEETAQ